MQLNQVNQAPGAPATDDLVADTTTQAFMKDVIEESKKRPVLVDFWAPWCGPCKTLTPILEKAVRAAKGKVKLVKMNIDEHPQIPGQLGVQSIPAIFAFANGQPIDGFLGALPEGQVAAFIERVLGKGGGAADAGPDIAEMLKAAEGLLADGDAAGAADLFAQVLAEDSVNVRALGGLARAHVAAGNLEPARQTLSLVPKGKENDPAVSAARAALELADQAAKVGDVECARSQARGQRGRPPGALRSRRRAQRQGRAGQGARSSDRDRAARPQVERRRRAQATRAILRSLGADRRDDARRKTPSFLDPVRVKLPSRNGRQQCR